MFFAILIICILIILGLLRIQFPKHYFAMRRLRGPPGLPLFGNALELDVSDNFKTTETTLKWNSSYGSPFKVKIGHLYWVTLNKASHVEVLLKSNANITKGS